MKVTKKEFKENYSNMRLAGQLDKPASDIIKTVLPKLKKADMTNTSEVTRIDIESVREIGKSVSIYKAENEHNTFYIVEFTIDYAKDTTCSWDNLHIFSVVYVLY